MTYFMNTSCNGQLKYRDTKRQIRYYACSLLARTSLNCIKHECFKFQELNDMQQYKDSGNDYVEKVYVIQNKIIFYQYIGNKKLCCGKFKFRQWEVMCNLEAMFTKYQQILTMYILYINLSQEVVGCEEYVMFNSRAEFQGVAKGKILSLIIMCEPCNLGIVSSSGMCSYVVWQKFTYISKEGTLYATTSQRTVEVFFIITTMRTVKSYVQINLYSKILLPQHMHVHRYPR